jgi:hypothetical protein
VSDALGSKNVEAAWFSFSFVPALHSQWRAVLAMSASSAIDDALQLRGRLDKFPLPPPVCPARWLLADIDSLGNLAELAGLYIYTSRCDMMRHPEQARALARAAGIGAMQAFHHAGSLSLPQTLRSPQIDYSQTIDPMRLGIGMMLAITQPAGAGVIERIRLKLPTNEPINFETTNFSAEDYVAWNAWMDNLYASRNSH